MQRTRYHRVVETPLRLIDHAGRWDVTIEEIRETESSVIAYGRRGALPVVLKVVRRPGDEWLPGKVLAAFAGCGAAHVYEHGPGALLMERLTPGTPLSELSLAGRDDEATHVLADVISRMSAHDSGYTSTTVEQWGQAFQRVSPPASVLAGHLLSEARDVFEDLCRSQSNRRLLHGDLHHYNILFDREHGWLAIDPKGVVGEVEYEIGAALRNPVERPDLFVDGATVEKRIERFASMLPIDAVRTLRWAFAQAVLAALWSVEDGADVDARHPFIRLAEVMRPMLVR